MKVKYKDLTGYRKPTSQEREEIEKYLRKEFAGIMKMQFFVAVFCGLIMAAMFWKCCTFVLNGKFDMEIFIFVIFGAAAIFLCRKAFKSYARNRLLMNKTIKGEFEVLDCMGIFFDPQIDSPTKGIVRVRTMDGIDCENEFLIDAYTARKYKNTSEVPLLLMRQAECGYCEIITEYNRKGDTKK